MTALTCRVPLGWFSIDGALCTACGACVPVCPYGLLELPDGPGPVRLVDPDLCTSCSACATVCPAAALALHVGSEQS